ncbi:hypothetical protein ACI2KR_31035 [Pseudomonas luteola]
MDMDDKVKSRVYEDERYNYEADTCSYLYPEETLPPPVTERRVSVDEYAEQKGISRRAAYSALNALVRQGEARVLRNAVIREDSYKPSGVGKRRARFIRGNIYIIKVIIGLETPQATS